MGRLGVGSVQNVYFPNIANYVGVRTSFANFMYVDAILTALNPGPGDQLLGLSYLATIHILTRLVQKEVASLAHRPFSVGWQDATKAGACQYLHTN